MERRKFLQNTCPTVTFAFFGFLLFKLALNQMMKTLLMALIQMVIPMIHTEMTRNLVME
jgi:hypothetical protein